MDIEKAKDERTNESTFKINSELNEIFLWTKTEQIGLNITITPVINVYPNFSHFSVEEKQF